VSTCCARISWTCCSSAALSYPWICSLFKGRSIYFLHFMDMQSLRG
jgi:hypothetical protein